MGQICVSVGLSMLNIMLVDVKVAAGTKKVYLMDILLLKHESHFFFVIVYTCACSYLELCVMNIILIPWTIFPTAHCPKDVGLLISPREDLEIKATLYSIQASACARRH
jgi:hypothetical protein